MSKYIILKVEDIEQEIKILTQGRDSAIKDMPEMVDGLNILLESKQKLLTNKQIDLSEEAINAKAKLATDMQFGEDRWAGTIYWENGYEQALIDLLKQIE